MADLWTDRHRTSRVERDAGVDDRPRRGVGDVFGGCTVGEVFG